MVNSVSSADRRLDRASTLVAVYVVITAVAIVALVLLSAFRPGEATPEAWGHALIVALFAVLLPLRLRAARRGRKNARTASGVIAGALVVVNVVEGCVPGAFPVWMRIEMLAVAVLMLGVLALVAPWRR